MAPAGLGVALGLAQWPLLRREVHGAVVWVAACAVGFGLAGPAAAWGERASRAAVLARQGERIPSIQWTAQGMAVVALGLCTAIGGAFLLASLRTQVLPGPRSRMPGAMAQFAILGLLLPLLVALEARTVSEAQGKRKPRYVNNVPSFALAPSQPPRTSSFSPGCVSRGCGPAMSMGDARPREMEPLDLVGVDGNTGRPVRPPRSRPVRTDRPDTGTPTVHDEHLFVLTGTGRIKESQAQRWNNASQPEPPPSVP
ncbi:hypothetical protein D7V93_43455 [Corallococcus llansteffanensis]|uniref:Uncharacterized protein n=2 Tax=Corallococcus llansteffanensis TaxID=2316731 RepID=A0A3A8MUL3_9BACT|nr:hypothetical protein D7V93_43455 [Corallococcus llansteffanensis]